MLNVETILKMNKKEYNKAKRLKRKIESYKYIDIEEIIKLERLRLILNKVRDY